MNIHTNEIESKWCCKIYPLKNDRLSAYQKIIGKLEFTNANNTNNFKTLLIPVVDQSGSMAGSPIEQVKYSLNRILDITYSNPSLMTTIIGYHDTAKSTEINKSVDVSYYKDIISNIHNDSGGTSFTSAFNEIKKVCQLHESNSEISSIVIIYLTDGNDTQVAKERRFELVASLKVNLTNVKNYVIHTIGLGNDHDYDFLNSLRQIGTSEGAYRFADPSEDNDSLSNKINSILNVITSSVNIPIKLINCPFKVIGGENGKYWIDLTNYDMVTPCKLTISINDDTFMVESEFDNNNMTKVNEFHTYLIDGIAQEILTLSKQVNNSLDKEIHLELLIQRSKALMIRLLPESADAQRLEKLRETVHTLQKGGSVDQKKINDMKFEGIYATKVSVKPKLHNPTSYPPKVVAEKRIFIDNWKTIPKKTKNRCISNVIGNYSNKDASDWILDNGDKADASTLLIDACATGRCSLVQTIIDSDCIDINAINSDGFTALDTAILYGHWNIYDLLIANSAKINQDGNTLLRTCLSNTKITFENDKATTFYNMYEKTASRMLKDNLACITFDLINSAPTNSIYEWLSERSNTDIPYETAITKGLYDIVCAKEHLIPKISLKSYMNIFEDSNPNYIKIIQLLLESGKVDPYEVIEIIGSKGETEITWPMFIACEKGKIDLFNLLMKYSSIDHLNKQNNKGTTALWIASCNRHVDIVNALLDNGVNPNIPNEKGDTALIACCQKGNDLLIELLLNAGAKLNLHNRNRDNAVLICCRTGHAKSLEMILKYSQLNDPTECESLMCQCAEIDGFSPIFAATELDKAECIKVCVTYGSKLEDRTANDNQIIKGGTPLHLACFRGALNAVRMLCELGANIVATTNVTGMTPLHLAIDGHYVDIVRYLFSIDKENKLTYVIDKEGRLPIYYANKLGNEVIFEEFFTNKLGLLLEKVMSSSVEIEKVCTNTLLTYGCSDTVYNYNFTSEIIYNNGLSLLSSACINGNKHLVEGLGKMHPDVHKKDNYGITSSFWNSYFGNSLNYTLDDDTLKMLDRVKIAEKKSLQHKMLLSLTNDMVIGCYDRNDQINVMTKMTQNYLIKIKDDVINQMKSSQKSSQSMLGFIEKLKSNKLTNKLDNVDMMIKDMKIHLISMIASENNLKLEPVHMLALYLYTGNLGIFNQVNMVLGDWDNHKLWHPFVHNLYQSITILPPFIGEVYRMVNIPFDQKEYAIGNKIIWNTFSICSSDWNNATEFITQKKGIIFIIKSLAGRHIGKFSKFRADNECIFLPGSSFVVNNIYKADIGCLYQENIRNSTFKVTDKDLEKATNQQCSIVVEIHEVADIKEIK